MSYKNKNLFFFILTILYVYIRVHTHTYFLAIITTIWFINIVDTIRLKKKKKSNLKKL